MDERPHEWEIELLQVVGQLRDLGYDVASLAELQKSGIKYKNAVPMLADWLETTSTVRAKEQIALALSFPWAKPEATAPLFRQFAHLPVEIDATGLGIRWRIGDAIYCVDDRAAAPEMIELALNPKFGRAREMIVLELGRVKTPEAIEALITLLDDPDVDGHAVKALSSRGVTAPPQVFQEKLSDRRAWVRAAARRAIDRSQGAG
jgi:HEAT repeat protein